MKPSSGEMIRRALEVERTKLAAEERNRIVALLEALSRAYYLAGKEQHRQAIQQAIKTIGRQS